ncbi:hypothetical protein D1872_325430 [compost metagenome]
MAEGKIPGIRKMISPDKIHNFGAKSCSNFLGPVIRPCIHNDNLVHEVRDRAETAVEHLFLIFDDHT